MEEDVLVPLFLFSFLTAIIVVPLILKHRDRARMHETLRVAFDRGQPVPPEIIEALQRDVKKVESPFSDLRRAVILICLGLGLATMGLIFGQFADEAQTAFSAFGVVPGFIGLGYLVLWFFTRRSKPL